jgi:membrane protease subunit (stomatin/prohibitin family)
MPFRRRPVARLAVGTAVVAGTAGAVARHSAASSQQAAQQAAPAAAAPEEDTYAQLTKLGELHASGVLTDEEFAAQKAKLLA